MTAVVTLGFSASVANIVWFGFGSVGTWSEIEEVSGSWSSVSPAAGTWAPVSPESGTWSEI